MAEGDELQRKLLESQNRDGGWGYKGGSSWVEPTALALLALEANQNKGSAYERGTTWLRQAQARDGGWPPNPRVSTSTWVTSLAILALSDTSFSSDMYRRGIEWTVRQVGPELSPIERIVLRLRGMPREEEARGGSPWFPGTAAWIAPTVMSVLALSDAALRNGSSELKDLIKAGKEYILSRRCEDGGWNHGGTRFRSQNAASYPEMTGMALLALYGVPESDLSGSIALAEKYLAAPGSIEGLSWLQMGLSRHGRDCLNIVTDLPCRTTRGVCLRLLALNSYSSSNKFVTQNC